MTLAPRLALCLLAAGLCIFQAQGMASPWDCCESTRDIPMSLTRLPIFKGYEIQGTERGCAIRAFVLITVRDRKLCYSLGSSVAMKFKNALDKKTLGSKGKTLLKMDLEWKCLEDGLLSPTRPSPATKRFSRCPARLECILEALLNVSEISQNPKQEEALCTP